MKIDRNKIYELHRPPIWGTTLTVEQVRGILTEEAFNKWLEARERAGTAGPIMVNDQISRMNGEQVDEMYTMGLKGGATPCDVDEETGQVFVGHFIFVPAPEAD